MRDDTGVGLRVLVAALCGALILSAARATADGCYSVVVGRQASADGFIIMAHNEDDGPPQVVNHHKVPRMNHPPGAEVRLINGGKLDQVELTWSYLWSEMPGMLFSDSYLNEWGVCIASDACQSREDKPELTDGGISYMLRRLVAERARSSREGVHIAAALVERFGYDGSGRTYIICDPDEGWLFCVVNGKHWLASRVPDDHVASVANTYSVRQVNVSDTMNCLASDDIVEYAIQRGWYDPDVDGPFDFAAAYADPETASDIRNYARQWSGLRRIASDPAELSAHLPTTVTPKRKMDVAMVMQILRDHYDGTELDVVDSATGNPHDAGVWTVCNSSTQTSFVAQLRRDMPPEVGFCWWICLGSPCQSVYVPFHFGIADFPEAYAGESQTPSETFYNMMLEDPTRVEDPEAFWLFKNIGHRVGAIYEERSDDLTKTMHRFESFMLSRMPLMERAIEVLVRKGEDPAGRLAFVSDQSYHKGLEAMRATVNRVAKERHGAKAEVFAIHLQNLRYLWSADAALLANAYSVDFRDLGGGPNGTGIVSMDEASLEERLAKKGWSSKPPVPIEDIVDTAKCKTLDFDEIEKSRFATAGAKVGFEFKPGDVLIFIPWSQDSRLVDAWFGVYRKENGEWKIIAGD
ncbi:MAG: C69 family dipeptidase [candidate division Zixibacteria bacterium]|nr:C69 family dipeptidase [candidate division Zixibacteria bacterium]